MKVGLEQANLLASVLEDVPFEVAYSSDLQRASKVHEYGLRLMAATERVANRQPKSYFNIIPSLHSTWMGSCEKG
jgi:broad specificity phosphatase PhoE